jgi:UDP-N-acetylglucosamine 2-epimerase (non-hydrolysing)
MTTNQSLGELTSRLTSQLDRVLKEEELDFVLVQGDTTTAFVGALVSFYNRIPIGHVEAGLRTSNLFEPFPEESNRRLISKIADLHFTPTVQATQNLMKEGIQSDSIFQTGNTGIDTLKYFIHEIGIGNKPISPSVKALSELTNLVLVTCHRRELFGDPLIQICKALIEIANSSPTINIVIPVHPNPNIKNIFEEQLSGCANIHLIEPLPYTGFVALLKSAKVIVTDSGGVQEEAPSIGKKIIVIRNETERNEAVTMGLATIVGADYHKIVDSVLEGLNNYQAMGVDKFVDIVGDGNSAPRIVRTLETFLESNLSEFPIN